MIFKLKNQPKLNRQEELNKKKKLLKSIILIFIIAIIILCIWIFWFKNKDFIRKYENDYLSFNYDSTWNLDVSEENFIALTNKTNSIVNIKISDLNTKDLNNSIEIISDEVRFDIENQNTEYKLLNEEKTNITKNMYEAYKLLYEDGENQNMVIIIRNDNNLYILNYISNNETFDIVLDSFQTILGSLKFK